MAMVDRIECERQGALVLKVNSRVLIEEDEAVKLATELREHAKDEVVRDVCLDLSGVEHLSTAYLGVFLTVNNSLRDRQGGLHLAGVHPQIYATLATMKLGNLIPMHQNVGDFVSYERN